MRAMFWFFAFAFAVLVMGANCQPEAPPPDPVCPTTCEEWCPLRDCEIPDGCENPGCRCALHTCDEPCSPTDCGPRPGRPNTPCDDGDTVAGPGECVRDDDGSCRWEWLPCPESCGGATCGEGTYCCNASCGICAPLDGACTQQVCFSAE